VDVEEENGDGDFSYDESKRKPPPNQLMVGRGTLVSVARATRPRIHKVWRERICVSN